MAWIAAPLDHKGAQHVRQFINVISYIKNRAFARPFGVAVAMMFWLGMILAMATPAHAALSTNATSEEQAWRAEHDVIQVGVYAGDHMPLESWVNGQPEGIGVDYVRLLANRAGLRLEFHPFTDWSLVSGDPRDASDFDILVAQPSVPERARRFTMLHPYTTTTPVLVIRQDHLSINRDGTLAGLRVAVERQLKQHAADLRKYYPKATLVFTDNGPEALDMVARGEADAYVGPDYSVTRSLLRLRAKDDLRIAGASAMPAVSVAPAMVKPDPVLARILADAESKVTLEDLYQLRQRWGIENVDAPPASTDGSTSAQNDWLRSVPELRVGYETDRFPYSFVNEHGQFDGIAADYLDLLRDRLGLRLKLIPAPDWNTLQAMVANHEVDLIVAGSAHDFSSQDMVFSQPYETFPGVIVIRFGGPSIASPVDLAHRVLAIRKEQSIFSRAKAMLGESQFVPVGSNESGLAMVASGKADAYIGTLPAIDSLIRNRYVAQLLVAGPAGFDVDLSIGVRPADALLLPYINRELNGVTAPQRQAIRARWLTTSYHYGVPWIWVVAGIAAAAALFSLGGFAYRRLRKTMNDKELAERQLEDELSFQHALLETLPYPVFVKDDQGRYLAVNRAYEQLFKVTRGDIVGKTPIEVGHTHDLPPEEVHEADIRVLNSGQSERVELILPSARGTNRVHSKLVWRRPFAKAASNARRMLGTIVDVSDIRSAEARARASEQRLSDITEAMPAVVYQIKVKPHAERLFSYVAGDSAALIGLSPEEIVADSAELAKRLHPDDRQRLIDHIYAAADSLKPMASMDFRFKVRGEWRWLRTEGGRVQRLPDGTAEWSGYWIDTTKAHQQEQELREAKLQAESAVTAKSAFLAAMSHEIRTPMAGVLGLIELLSRTRIDTDQATMLGMAGDSAKLLLQILDDILDYSRIEADRVDIETAPFDLRLLVDGVAGLFLVGAASKKLRLHVIYDPRLGQLFRGDALRIRQILTNLMSNALKFTEAGSVVVHADLVDASSDGRCVRFTVSDTGIGISPENLARLFRPFTQAEQSTARRFGGAGLGLSISRRLAEMMDGRLHLESRPGRGTDAIFEIPLPLVEAEAQAQAREFEGRIAAVNGATDELFEELDSCLRSLGFEVRRNHPADGVPVDIEFQAYATEAGDHPAELLSEIEVSRGGGAGAEALKLQTNPVLWAGLRCICQRLLDPGSATRPPPSSTLSVPTPDIRILIAEDHAINRTLIHRQLDVLGYGHVLVEDGLEALEQLGKAHFDLLIVDCHMPGMDGFELTRRIRQMERSGVRLPILALSASTLPEQVQNCKDAGMDGFLAKPVMLGELEIKIHELIGRPMPNRTVTAESEVDRHAANLAAFYKDPDDLRAVLAELIPLCRKDLAELEASLANGDEAEIRFRLHRLEGSLGVVGSMDGEDPPEPTASTGERMAWIAARIERHEAFLQSLEGTSADSGR